jgi:hypothetical protein
MVDVSATGQATTIRPNPNEGQGGAATVRRRREEEQNNNLAANVGAQDRVDIRQNRPQANERNVIAENAGTARGARAAREVNPARDDNPNARENPRAERAEPANRRNNTRQVREENIITRPTGQPADQTGNPETTRAARRFRNELIHGNQPGNNINTENRDRENRIEPDTPREEPPNGNETIAKRNVPETRKNVQETVGAIRKKDAKRAAAEKPALDVPKLDIARINLSSPDNKNPRTPGLEGSIAQKAEAAHVKGLENEARFEQLREKNRQIQEQQTQLAENRNPVAVQTQVGRNVDRLI